MAMNSKDISAWLFPTFDGKTTVEFWPQFGKNFDSSFIFSAWKGLILSKWECDLPASQRSLKLSLNIVPLPFIAISFLSVFFCGIKSRCSFCAARKIQAMIKKNLWYDFRWLCSAAILGGKSMPLQILPIYIASYMAWNRTLGRSSEYEVFSTHYYWSYSRKLPDRNAILYATVVRW